MRAATVSRLVGAAIALTGGGLVGVVGCHDRDLPGQIGASEHFRYHARPDDDAACVGLLPLLEEHAQTVGTALGVQIPIVDYYKFDGLDDFGSNSRCGAVAACAPGTSVESPGAFDRHELVHAYLAPLGRPPWLLVEGTAVTLACQRYPRPEGSWRDLYQVQRTSPALYGAGGWLVGHLLKTYPAERFVGLYAAVPGSASADELAEIFAEIYGADLDEAWSAAIAAADAPLVCPWECTRPPFAFPDVSTTLAPVCPGGGASQHTFELPSPRGTRWVLDGDASFFLRSCDGIDEPSTGFSGGSGPTGVVAPLGQGRYFIDLQIEGPAAVSLVGGEESGAVPAPDCAAAPPLPGDLLSLRSLTLHLPGAGVTRFVNLGAGTPRRGSLRVAGAQVPDAAICSSCDAGACQPIPPGQTVTLPGVSPDSRLRFGPSSASAAASFFWF